MQQRRAQHRVLAAHRVGQPQRRRVGIGGDEAPGVRLGVPGADEHVLEHAAEPLLGREVARDGAPERHRVRHAVEHDPRHLLDDVDLPRHVARAEGRHRHVPSLVDLEVEPLEDRPLLGVRHVEADHRARPLGAQRHDRALGQPVVHVDRAGRLGAREVDQEPAREHGRRLGRIRVDALLPLVRALGAEREPLGRLEDPDRLEVRRLEQHVGGLVGDLGLEPAHDRGERDRLLAVRDQEIARAGARARCRRASAASRPRARGGRRSGRRRASRGRTRAAGCPTRASRSSSRRRRSRSTACPRDGGACAATAATGRPARCGSRARCTAGSRRSPRPRRRRAPGS